VRKLFDEFCRETWQITEGKSRHFLSDITTLETKWAQKKLNSLLEWLFEKKMQNKGCSETASTTNLPFAHTLRGWAEN